MKLIVTAAVAALGALSVLDGAEAALPLSHPGPTVNDYTQAQSERALAAARRAGFAGMEIAMVQDGNFFLHGEKDGKDFAVTVTRDGAVYSSAPASDS